MLISRQFRIFHYFCERCRLHGFEPMIYDTAVMVENMIRVCPDQEVIGIAIDSFIEDRQQTNTGSSRFQQKRCTGTGADIRKGS